MAFKDLPPDKYRQLSARRMARLVAEQRVSPVQLVECALALAKAWEPKVNAYVTFLEGEALKAAAAAERGARRGRLRGSLHGVPIAIKDNFHLTGHVVTRGSRTSAGYIAERVSPMVERMLTAGAVIIGRTTMPEFGWKGTGSSPLTGITRNPWDASRNPGGSSAGSAVTVASGAVPIALGSDAGGSIRIPASFCGVVGLKPTLGRIPVWPGTVTETLSHVGPLCRFVDDARIVLDATAGADPRDPLSYAANPPHRDGRKRRLGAGTLRVGILAQPFGIRPDAGVEGSVGRALRKIRRTVKARYRNVEIAAELPRRIFETLWITGRGHGFADIIARHSAVMDPGLVRLADLARAFDVGDLFKANEERRRLLSALCTAMEDSDVLVMPTMPITAFAADAEVPAGGEASAPLPWVTWTPFTYCFNLSGQPAISVPCGWDDQGLPVGLQIVGPWGGDALVLAVARRFEAALAITGTDRQLPPVAA
jgi:aspartyl-tRNA(Asn)/glutamyl-tRNA(Gln) amidotransferase subunit A